MQAQKREREEQEKLLKEFELRRQIKATVVPTDDGKVRAMLRALREPITLFGEKEVRDAGGWWLLPTGVGGSGDGCLCEVQGARLGCVDG